MTDLLHTDLAFLPVLFGRNELTHVIDAADPNLTSRVGLKYYLEIQLPEFPLSENFVPLHRSEGREKPVGTNGSTTLYEGAEFSYNDRNGKLDGQLSLLKPEYLQQNLRVSVTQTTPFKLREIVQGGTPAVSTDKTGPAQWVAKAGISPEHLPGYQNEFFSKYQQTARQFLTWQPNRRIVSVGEEVYLSFLLNCFPLPATLRLRMSYRNTLGQDSSPVTLSELSGLTAYAVVLCPVGPAAITLPPDCESYQVWLSDQDNRRISEVREYIVETIYEPYQRHLLFANSLGGWDSLRLTGGTSEKLKVSQVTAERARRSTDPVDFPEILVVSTEGERELTVSTGYFIDQPEAWLRYLDELVLSEEIYLVTDQGHEPVRRTTSELTDFTDGVFMNSRTFTLVKQAKVQNFSQLPPNTPEKRATSWLGMDYAHVLDSQGKRTGKMTATRLKKVYADDGSDFKPLTIKPNTAGDPDYQGAIFFPDVTPGTTPYPNAAITRKTNFTRATCGNGYWGGPATVYIPAGKYGGEAAGNADALAEAEYTSKNTQAYTDENGVCDNSPQNYAWTVPSGHWHFRTNRPADMLLCEGGFNVQMGNAWFLSGSSPYKYKAWSNDLDFPAPATGWRFGFYYGPALKVKIYVNGSLVHQVTLPQNDQGYAQFFYSTTSFQSGDRVYVELTAA